ncbi:DEAD/DEAH box helicase [Patescibacteria group bacterium]|nr:DEAD/DEAH box helicase [Patescibacteria group bacterium]
MIAQAPSGTGKTASYSVGLLQQIDYTLPHLQALVLVPTRELAAGVSKVIESLGDFCGIKTMYVTGGHSVREGKLFEIFFFTLLT